MELWLFYAPGTDQDIKDACAAAAAELTRRGFTAERAYAAAERAGELSDADLAESTPDADAVAAWYAAEDVAFRRLQELTGEWPHNGALIVIHPPAS